MPFIKWIVAKMRWTHHLLRFATVSLFVIGLYLYADGFLNAAVRMDDPFDLNKAVRRI